jgi:hypothetical protein
MSTLTWNHTRTGLPMTLRGSRGSLLVRAMMIRQVRPRHPLTLDGQPL